MTRPASFDTLLSAGDFLCHVSIGGTFCDATPWNAYRHSHQAYELLFADSGLYRVDFGTEKVTLSAGQVLIIAPGVVHSTHTLDSAADGDKASLTLRFSHNPSPVGESGQLREWQRVRAFFEGISKYRRIDNARAVLSHVDNLGRELSASPRSVLSVHSRLLGILSALLAASPSLCQEEERPATLDEQREALLNDYFDFQTARQRPGETELADQLGISRRHLNRIVRKAYGRSFQEQLLANRMEAAAFLLEHSSLSLRELAEHLGYDSYSGFFLAFRKYYGVPPTLGRRIFRSHL